MAAGVIIENVAAFAPAGSAPEPLPAEPQVSVADELGKLADLRDRGILSEPDDWNNPSIERRTNPVARLFKAFGLSGLDNSNQNLISLTPETGTHPENCQLAMYVVLPNTVCRWAAISE